MAYTYEDLSQDIWVLNANMGLLLSANGPYLSTIGRSLELIVEGILDNDSKNYCYAVWNQLDEPLYANQRSAILAGLLYWARILRDELLGIPENKRTREDNERIRKAQGTLKFLTEAYDGRPDREQTSFLDDYAFPQQSQASSSASSSAASSSSSSTTPNGAEQAQQQNPSQQRNDSPQRVARTVLTINSEEHYHAKRVEPKGNQVEIFFNQDANLTYLANHLRLVLSIGEQSAKDMASYIQQHGKVVVTPEIWDKFADYYKNKKQYSFTVQTSSLLAASSSSSSTTPNEAKQAQQQNPSQQRNGSPQRVAEKVQTINSKEPHHAKRVELKGNHEVEIFFDKNANPKHLANHLERVLSIGEQRAKNMASYIIKHDGKVVVTRETWNKFAEYYKNEKQYSFTAQTPSLLNAAQTHNQTIQAKQSVTAWIVTKPCPNAPKNAAVVENNRVKVNFGQYSNFDENRKQALYQFLRVACEIEKNQPLERVCEANDDYCFYLTEKQWHALAKAVIRNKGEIEPVTQQNITHQPATHRR